MKTLQFAEVFEELVNPLEFLSVDNIVLKIPYIHMSIWKYLSKNISVWK